MLETIMSGAMWPAVRVNSISSIFPDLCPRCKLAPETALHTFWTCPCNKDIDEPIIAKTNKHIQRAVDEADVYPCLWFRGLLPTEIIDKVVIPAPTDDINIEYINPENIEWTSGVYYGDASGGEHTQHSKLRRCGVGLVSVLPDGTINFGLHTNMPGVVQSVGRGELMALLILLRLLLPGVDCEFVTDNENVWKTFSGGPRNGANSANCDMYEEVFRLIYDKAIKIKVRWMPSHLREKLPTAKSHVYLLMFPISI
jgi:hypothetical protein